MKSESVTLYFRQGASDKVYQAQLEAAGKGFVVRFQYGRRGGALQSGIKTASPLPYEQAKPVFDALVKAKAAKGYTPSEGGVPYQPLPVVSDVESAEEDLAARDPSFAIFAEKKASGMPVQVLTAITDAELERCLTDDDYIAQEKYDGERRTVAHRKGGAIGGNKLGVLVPLPLALAASVERLTPGSELDGELVGEVLYAFDLLSDGGKDVRKLALMDRYERLCNAVNRAGSPANIVVAPTASGTEYKRALFEKLKKKEGVVFKRAASAYKPGNGKNPDQLKYKFVESATLEVSGIHPTKRSVTVQAFAKGKPVPLGSVTVSNNKPMPKIGAIVEVRYLYCVDALFQAVYLGERTDQTRESCTLAQIKYKSAS